MPKILYVDDEDDIREIAAMALEMHDGFDVRVANGGKAGLEVAREFEPDLIMLDVMMPGLDGISTYKLAQEDADIRGIPVAFITARTQTHQVEELMGLGACAVIPKPFDPVALAGQVEALLHRRAG